MNDYRRGTVLGLTVAETFILLTFLLLIALLGLVRQDEPTPEPDTPGAPGIWVRPDEIAALRDEVTKAQINQEKAERDRDDAERGRDEAQEEATEAQIARKKAERDRAAVEHERDEVQKEAVEAQMAQEKAERDRAAMERERDRARRTMAKGKNPPCWYQIVSTGEGKNREKPYYLFNVAIFEDSIELAPRTAPPGGALDDGGGPYANEWKRLRIEELPYGRTLSDNEFADAVTDLVTQGRNRQVRTYACVFSVMVWDKTPDHAKKRWKDAHDRIIEGFFSAYTVQDLEWTGVKSP